MYSRTRYRERQAKGLCPNCGRLLDQRPYEQCRLCYTPHPRLPRWPTDPEEAAYLRRIQGRAPLEIACCGGKFYAVEALPATMPCCGRVFEEVDDAL